MLLHYRDQQYTECLGGMFVQLRKNSRLFKPFSATPTRAHSQPCSVCCIRLGGFGSRFDSTEILALHDLATPVACLLRGGIVTVF